MSEQQASYHAGSQDHRDTSETRSDPVAAYLATLASKWGRIGQKQALDRMAVLLGYKDSSSLDWSKLSHQETAALPGRLMEVYAPGTANRYLGALKGVLKQAYLLGQMSEDDYRRAIKLKMVDDIAAEGRVLSQEEISALLQACDDGTKVGARDAAIIALLYAAGLRSTELTALEMEDYHNGELLIENGWDEERSLSLQRGAREALQSWLNVRGEERGPLFFAFKNGDSMQQGIRIFSQALSGLLDRRAKIARIEKVTPGDLRETFILHLLKAGGVDIFLICRLTGIKDVRTIARYDRRGPEALKEAMNLLDVPYQRRV